jgi:hypothetical protein
MPTGDPRRENAPDDPAHDRAKEEVEQERGHNRFPFYTM